MKKKNRFLANKTFVVFSILAVCIILAAVFAPVVTRGVDPLKGSLVDALLPPCKEHIFGTDKMGRDIGSMMLELAARSFLGFGAKPPAPEWGYMLNEGRECMQSAPWLMIFPGLAIFVVVVVFNMLGDSIRDILDPRNE